jgi:hypothetical protein
MIGTDIATAIIAIKSDAQVSVSGEDINSITWHDGNPTNITDEAILAKQTELQSEYDAQEYARNRQAEYPSIDDLIVALWENVIEERAASVIELEAKRQDVKTKYPKS